MKWEIDFTDNPDVYMMPKPKGVVQCPIFMNCDALPTNFIWYPLGEYGRIHLTEDPLEFPGDLPREKHIHKHWRKFSDDTRVGWQGPIMLWKDVYDKPSIIV